MSPGKGGDVPGKVAVSPRKWQHPWEGGNVLRKVTVCSRMVTSSGSWLCPQEGGILPGKVELSPGR